MSPSCLRTCICFILISVRVLRGPCTNVLVTVLDPALYTGPRGLPEQAEAAQPGWPAGNGQRARGEKSVCGNSPDGRYNRTLHSDGKQPTVGQVTADTTQQPQVSPPRTLRLLPAASLSLAPHATMTCVHSLLASHAASGHLHWETPWSATVHTLPRLWR